MSTALVNNLTGIVIAQNEAKNITACLENLSHLTERILVIDNNSTDQTATLAQKAGAKVIPLDLQNFSQLRTLALRHVKTDWVFYLDADERLTPDLANEIAQMVATGAYQAGSFLRQNFFYGSKITAGGYQRDLVTRLFLKKNLRSWQGKIHESPVYSGQAHTFLTPLLHFTHRSTAENLIKSAHWTAMEAELLAAAPQTKPVKGGTLLRKGLAEFYRRYFLQKGYRDGRTGFMEAFVQGLNRSLVYLQVWEKQLQPDLDSRYQKLEDQVKKTWPKST